MEENKTKKHMPTWVKLALAAIPVLIPSVFTYITAKMETDKANERAAMSYEALVGTVEKLQEAVEKLSEAQGDLKVAQAELKGRVEAGERFTRSRPAPTAGLGIRKPPESDNDGIPDMPAPVQLERLPKSLEALSQSKK